MLEASVRLAQDLKTPREVWMGSFALGELLVRLGKDKEAEDAFNAAAGTIESIASALKTDAFIRSFLAAAPVIEVFRVLGRTPPVAKPPSGR